MEPKWQVRVVLAAAIPLLLLGVPRAGDAVTRVNGNYYLEDTQAEGPNGGTGLFQGGLNLSILPPTKKKLQARLSMQLNYTATEEEKRMNFSPVGNLGLDLGDEVYQFNVQFSQFATVSTTADLTETRTSRAALSLSPKDLPRIAANVSRTESAVKGVSTTTDTATLFGEYRYRWVNLRGGYSTNRRDSAGSAGQESTSLQAGAGGSYELLPRTILSLDYDVNRFSSGSDKGDTTETTGNAFHLTANSRPVEALQLVGNFSSSRTVFDSSTSVVAGTSERNADLTANVDPYLFLRLSGTAGQRRFTDASQTRHVDFTTFGAAVNQRVRDTIQLGLNASRRFESDPDQGDNTNDTFGLNMTADLTSRAALRANVNVTRNEVPSFVSTKGFDASGTLVDRGTYDDRPPGFTFFDEVHHDVYTKSSASIGDWSAPVHFDPVTERFSTSKSVQVNATPSDKTGLALTYTSSVSSDRLKIASAGSQALNGSLTYVPNRRTNYSLSGTVSLPENGGTSWSGTGSMTYRFFRRHQLNLSYGRQVYSGRSSDNFSGTLGLALRKQARLELALSSTNLFREDRTEFFRVRFSKSF